MKDTITYSADGNASSFSGPAAMNVYGMAVLASALRLYATSRIRVNRSYTPSRMMSAGRTYLGEDARGIAGRDYSSMADALVVRVRDEKARIAAQAEVEKARAYAEACNIRDAAYVDLTANWARRCLQAALRD